MLPRKATNKTNAVVKCKLKHRVVDWIALSQPY